MRRSSSALTSAPNPMEVAVAAIGDNFFKTGKSAADNKENICRINLQEFLLRVFASTLRRHGSDRAFHYFQQAPVVRPRRKHRE